MKVRTSLARKLLPAILTAVAALLAISAAGAAGPPGKGDPVHANPKTTVIIDYAEPFNHHKPGHDKGKPSGGGDTVDHSAGHYELIGGIWADADAATPEVDPKLAFTIDLRGFPSGSAQAILNAFAAWEEVTSGDLFDEAGTTFQNADVVFGDGVNTYSMRNLGGRALAATFISWDDADNDGRIDIGERFLEMDVVHNSTVKWATDETSAGAKGRWFDVQNVATHEIGHVFGLDHPGDAHERDLEQTMYASAAPHETKKRTLEADGDIPGIQDSFLGYGAAP